MKTLAYYAPVLILCGGFMAVIVILLIEVHHLRSEMSRQKGFAVQWEQNSTRWENISNKWQDSAETCTAAIQQLAERLP